MSEGLPRRSSPPALDGRRAPLRSLRLARPADLTDPPGGSEPDAVILDLAACTAAHLPELLARARTVAARGRVVMRLGPLDAGIVDAELDLLEAAWPDAVVLPAVRDGRDIQHCGVKLGVREARLGRPAGATAIIAALGPAGFLAPAGFQGASVRLAGLTWDRARLAAEVGADRAAFEASGDAAAVGVVRTLLLLSARAAGVPAYEAASDATGAAFAADCRQARALGFDGRFGHAPAQIATINAVFGAL